jgi:hypothetical protein
MAPVFPRDTAPIFLGRNKTNKEENGCVGLRLLRHSRRPYCLFSFFLLSEFSAHCVVKQPPRHPPANRIAILAM